LPIDILNIPFYDGTIAEIVHTLVATIGDNRARRNILVSPTDAHVLICAQKDPEFKKILREYFLNLPDGMPNVWISRLKGSKRMQRCYGPDLFREVLTATANKPISHFLCGGMKGVAEDLRTVCAHQFGNGNIRGVYCPPFREMSEEEYKELGALIDSQSIDIIWVGLSSPKQHKFAYRLSKYTHAYYIIVVGAAFDIHTERVVQAPKFIQSAGFEWLFRIFAEPKRLLKRYAAVVPLYIYYNIKHEFFRRRGIK
jgi:N-acetylglucosaminyldiphosphoundecaprenol N-acetyl-beta-D-mannosaminyltransferase